MSRTALSEILGLLCTEQDVGNLNKMHFQEFWDSCAQNKTSEVLKKHALSGILGLLCEEQDVGNLKNMHFQELWDSCAQNYTSEFSNTCSFRNSGTPVRRRRRRKYQNGPSEIMGPLCAEQDAGNLNKLTFRNFGTSVR